MSSIFCFRETTLCCKSRSSWDFLPMKCFKRNTIGCQHQPFHLLWFGCISSVYFCTRFCWKYFLVENKMGGAVRVCFWCLLNKLDFVFVEKKTFLSWNHARRFYFAIPRWLCSAVKRANMKFSSLIGARFDEFLIGSVIIDRSKIGKIRCRNIWSANK